jgi:hypothetical protein
MISTSLSIIQGHDSNSFAAAIMHFPRQSVAMALFTSDGRSADPANGYRDIWDFMKRELSDPNTTQVLIAVPTIDIGSRIIITYPVPVLVLEADSIYLKILRYLSEKKYCVFMKQSLFLVGANETIEVVLITPSNAARPKSPAEEARIKELADRVESHTQTMLQGGQSKLLEGGPLPYMEDGVDEELHVRTIHRRARQLARELDQEVLVISPPPGGFEGPPPHNLMILYQTITHAYMHFLSGRHPSLTGAAVAAGLIAYNDSLYYYFASTGIVQSSQDVVQHFRQAELSNLDQGGFHYRYPGSDTSVLSAEEMYVTKIGKYSRFSNIDQIPLKYAVAMRKYQELCKVSEANAQKFALLTVCKQWRIRLYCERFRAAYLFRSHQDREEEQLIFGPQQFVEPWIMGALS